MSEKQFGGIPRFGDSSEGKPSLPETQPHGGVPRTATSHKRSGWSGGPRHVPHDAAAAVGTEHAHLVQKATHRCTWILTAVVVVVVLRIYIPRQRQRCTKKTKTNHVADFFLHHSWCGLTGLPRFELDAHAKLSRLGGSNPDPAMNCHPGFSHQCAR